MPDVSSYAYSFNNPIRFIDPHGRSADDDDDCTQYPEGSEERKQCLCEYDPANCPDDVLYYFHSDHLGSSSVLTDADGKTYQFTVYLPWGEVLAEQKAAEFSTPYQFNGKELDKETGLYNYGARYYDPSLSLWLGVDPLADKFPGWNPYNYTMNNPINMIDPDGRAPTDWYKNLKNGTYTWFSGSGERIGYSHVGGKGSLLGDFESHLNDIHPKSGLSNGIYTDFFSIDITSSDKGALLPTDGKGGGNFLDEFVNGKGPMISVMLGDHPYTESMKDAPGVEAARNYMLSGENDVPGQLTNWRGKFHPIKGPLSAGFDLAEQFVGSFSLNIFPTDNCATDCFILSDTKSRTSLFYHLPIDNVDRTDSRAMKQGMGTTYQYYLWKEPIIE